MASFQYTGILEVNKLEKGESEMGKNIITGSEEILKTVKNVCDRRRINFLDNTHNLAPLLEEVERYLSYGCTFPEMEASFELMIRGHMGQRRSFFKPKNFNVMSHSDIEHGINIKQASVLVEVGGKEKHVASGGEGLVNALDCALRGALVDFYPRIKEMELGFYTVESISNGKYEGTASRVKVLTTFNDKDTTWKTGAVSVDVIEASWNAVLDGLWYKLLIDDLKNHS